MRSKIRELGVLHICNDFSGTKVHQNLFTKLDILGVRQIIFHPLRSANNINKNGITFEDKGSLILYSNILKKYHRVFFRKKINFLYRSLIREKKYLQDLDIQHATTLFSDGALAYKIFKEFGVPFVVTLRNTDINQFLLYRPDLYLLGLRILRSAKQVIFISPSLKNKFYQNFFFSRFQQEFESKTHIINNGIDDFWLKHIQPEMEVKQRNFLFVGAFDSNKNVLTLIDAFDRVKDIFPDIKLNLVGGGGSHHNQVLKKIETRSWIRFYGRITDKKELQEIYRSNDFFVMASIFETFGLVYIEALSQGLPVGYTKGQGIDGIFELPVGVSFNAKNTKDIELKILEMINDRNKYVKNIRNIDYSRFCWASIAKRYLDLYNTAIEMREK